MHTLTKLAGAIAGTAAAAILAASPASADAETLEEVAYVMALDDEGIAYSSEDAALAVGYSTCDALDKGATFPMLIRNGVLGSHGYYSAGDVGYITGAAIGAFCPEYEALITGTTRA